MSAVDDLFAGLRQRGQRALIPFLTAGDPDLPFTQRLLRELDQRGASLCEVGIPYSDPIADGPVIQASYTRSLEQGVRLAQVFEAIRATGPQLRMPLVTMVSYAIVHRHGLESFVDQAQTAGFSGAIVPDLLVEEAEPLAAVCRQRDFSLIQLVTPTTPRDRVVRIAEQTTGFLYYVSVTGITGERTALPDDLVADVAWLRQRTTVPICVGFGISRPEQVRQLAEVADGLIVGSAIVRKFADVASQGRDAVIDAIGDFVEALLAALPAGAP